MRMSFHVLCLDSEPLLTPEHKKFLLDKYGGYVKEIEFETAHVLAFDNKGLPGVIATNAHNDETTQRKDLVNFRRYWFHNNPPEGENYITCVQKEVLTCGLSGYPAVWSWSNIIDTNNHYSKHINVQFVNCAQGDIIASISIYDKDSVAHFNVSMATGEMKPALPSSMVDPKANYILAKKAVEWVYKYGAPYKWRIDEQR